MSNVFIIDGQEYEFQDALENITIPDSFVKKNKLKKHRGAGEARLYVGSYNKIKNKGFFSDNLESFEAKACFLKKDFMIYLKEAEFEYKNQEQEYKNNIANSLQGYNDALSIKNEVEYFNIEPALDTRDHQRLYIRQKEYRVNDTIWTFFRSVMLPIISFVSIIKLKKSKTGEIIFLFRPYLDYAYNNYYNPKKIEQVKTAIEKKTNESAATKKTLIDARIGQGKFRDKLLEESAECIITRVNDERLLIAGHIKPWAVANDAEKIDSNNGLMLTPTYDKMFDQGFITFTENGILMISPHISPLNIKKLNIKNGDNYATRIKLTDKRKSFLAYHRENIFKK